METAPAIQQIHPKTRQAARCRRDQEKPRTERTGQPRPNGFLSRRFKPFWAVEQRGFKEIEEEFFRSANNLCRLHGLPLPQTGKFGFPQNIAHNYLELCKALKKQDEKLECSIIRDDTHRATLITLKSYDTGRCLYYIPVRPLWLLLKKAEMLPLAEMLVSVFAYLVQVAQVPFYTQSDSYVGYQYDMLEQWISEMGDEGNEEDAEYQRFQLAEIEELEAAGEIVAALIGQPEAVSHLERHIRSYSKWENRDLETERMCSAFLELSREFPTQSVFHHIHADLFETDEDNRIQADQYISFYWSGKDCLQDTLFEMINNEFQECAYTDEPMVIQVFDAPHSQPLNNLNFEKRLFELMDKLCEILTPYDHD